MPNQYTAPQIKYGATPIATLYTLTGIQTVTLRSGRQRSTDPFPASQLNIELIPANSYTLALAIGQYLEVKCTNEFGSFFAFKGYIDSVQRSYGYKYNAGTGAAPEDRIYISASCALGKVAKYTFSERTAGFINSDTALYQIGFSSDVIFTFVGDTNREVSMTDPLTGSAIDFANQVARTAQVYMSPLDENTVIVRDPSEFAGSLTTQWSFSDNPTNLYEMRMSALEYEASIYNSTNRVIVEPADFAPASASTGSAPFYSYQFSSFDASTSAASELAGYIVNLNNDTAPTPVSVTAQSSIQGSTVDQKNWPQSMTQLGEFIGTVADITFRSTTVLAICEGFYAVWSPSDFSFTGYFSPSLGVPFILDSDDFGILDQNRLGL